jgi:hypothetical protein
MKLDAFYLFRGWYRLLDLGDDFVPYQFLNLKRTAALKVLKCQGLVFLLIKQRLDVLALDRMISPRTCCGRGKNYSHAHPPTYVPR